MYKNVDLPRDRHGEIIDVGYVITYPVRRGSQLYVIDAVVEAVSDDFLIVTPLLSTYKAEKNGITSLEPKQVKVTKFERVTVLPHVDETSLLPRILED